MAKILKTCDCCCGVGCHILDYECITGKQLECKICSGEDNHYCECGETLTKEQCKEFSGYCDDICGQKYCK